MRSRAPDQEVDQTEAQQIHLENVEAGVDGNER